MKPETKEDYLKGLGKAARQALQEWWEEQHPKVAYVAGPYRNSPEGIERAIRFAKLLWSRGIPNICPHANSLNFEYDIPNDDIFLDGYLDILRKCDEIYILPGWEKSAGTLGELGLAIELGLKIWWVKETDEGFAITSIEEMVANG